MKAILLILVLFSFNAFSADLRVEYRTNSGQYLGERNGIISDIFLHTDSQSKSFLTVKVGSGTSGSIVTDSDFQCVIHEGTLGVPNDPDSQLATLSSLAGVFSNNDDLQIDCIVEASSEFDMNYVYRATSYSTSF